MARKNATPPQTTRLQMPVRRPEIEPEVGIKRARVSQNPNVYVFDSNGVLACSNSAHTPMQGAMPWCPDIEMALRGGVDADWCFDPGSLIVPMFPAEHGLFAEVRLDPEDMNGSRKLLLPVRKDGNFEAGLDFIGFISKGEGRMVVRDMLISWLAAKRDLGCESRIHGRLEEAQIRNNESHAASADSKAISWFIANRWAIADQGLCLPCYKKMLAAERGTAQTWGMD